MWLFLTDRALLELEISLSLACLSNLPNILSFSLFLSPAFSKKSGGTLFLVFHGAWCVVPSF